MHKRGNRLFPRIVLRSDYEMVSKEWVLLGCNLPGDPWRGLSMGFNYIWVGTPDIDESGNRGRVDYKVKPDRLVRL